MGAMGDPIGGFLEVVPPQMREPLLFVVFAGFSIGPIPPGRKPAGDRRVEDTAAVSA